MKNITIISSIIAVLALVMSGCGDPNAEFKTDAKVVKPRRPNNSSFLPNQDGSDGNNGDDLLDMRP